MSSAHYENHHDNRDISAIWRAPWRVTAELNEMVQYQNVYLIRLINVSAFLSN